MARYDYGMRGFRETAPRLARGGYRAERYRPDRDERMDPTSRTPRVTARYNRDYVFGARGPRYPRNYFPYAGDPRAPVLDEYAYRHPYMTVGGTRTMRGAVRPGGYDSLYSGYYRGRDY